MVSMYMYTSLLLEDSTGFDLMVQNVGILLVPSLDSL